MLSFLVLSLYATCAPTNITKITPKIINGTRVPFKYPWITSIQFEGIHLCAGVLVDYDTMITAAHCAEARNGPYLRVKANRDDLAKFRFFEGGVDYKVRSISNHPDHRYIDEEGASANDISVWKLEFEAGDSKYLPTGMVELDDGSFSNVFDNDKYLNLKIAGWGRTSVNGPRTSAGLFEAQVGLLSNQECFKFYPGLLRGSTLCASGYGKDTTEGDSGGPLFYQKSDGKIVLVGINSFGLGLEYSNYPTVYARISKFKNWINSQI